MLLYDLDVSGNCYKIRLFAALTNTKLDLVPVNLAAGQNRDPDFRKLNPFGEIPVLVDGDFILRDSQAILIYLAGRLTDRSWWPEDAISQATITQWLSVASSEICNGPNAARLIRKFGYPSTWARPCAGPTASSRCLIRMSRHKIGLRSAALQLPTALSFPTSHWHPKAVSTLPLPGSYALARSRPAFTGFRLHAGSLGDC